VYRLESGEVKLYALSAAGLAISSTYIQPGQTFGEEALVGATTRSLHAEAVVRSRVQMIGRAGLAARRSQPDVLLGLSLTLWERPLEVGQQVENLVAYRVPYRLANALVHFARKWGQRTPGGTRLPSRLTHQALADYIGARRETVTVLIGELARVGLITRDPGRYRSIVIPDLERLARYAADAGGDRESMTA